MAEESPLRATGALTEVQYERLAHPQAAEGLVGHPSGPAPVSVSGGQVIIREGMAGLVRGFPWASGNSPIVYTPSLTGPNRVDLVVLRLSRDDAYRVGSAIRTGTSETPPVPFSGTGPTDWYEVPLAEVRMASGALTLQKIRAWYIGEDGQILCTSVARPPNLPGRRIFETDTGRAYISTGTSWAPVLDDSGWVNMTAVPYWSAYSVGYQVRRQNSSVHMRLSVQRTSGSTLQAGTDTNVGQVPAGFRPNYSVPVLGYLDGANLARAFVLPNGYVQIQNYTVPITTGISFTAHTASWTL